MKLVFKICIFISVLYTNTLFASQCASLQFKHNDRLVVLDSVNYKQVEEKYSYKDLLNGKGIYYLAEGPQLLSLFAVKKQKRIMRLDPSTTLDIMTDDDIVYLAQQYYFEAGYSYTFIYDDQPQTISLLKKTPRECKMPEGTVLEGASSSTTLTMSRLPENLEKKLQAFRQKSFRHYQIAGKSLPIGNIDPLKVNRYFGTVTENSYTTDGHIKLLSVLPSSPAFNLGLRTGDEIISFDNTGISISFDNKKPIDALNLYLKIIRNNNYQIKMMVQRQNRKFMIEGEDELVFVPSSIFSFGSSELLNNISFNRINQLSNALQFDYEQLTMSLVKFYSQRDISTEYIQLFRPEEKIESLGLEGVLDLGTGVQVELLIEDSPLKSIGVMEGDILTKINGRNITKSLTPLIEEVTALNNDDQLKIQLIRNSQQYELNGTYKKPVLPQFNLLLNLRSKERALAMMTENKRNVSRGIFIRSDRWNSFKPNATPPMTPGELNRNRKK
ncbi:PDZ domain-containing protein [Thalassotalea sediminis]|uniref:PDZ domain-containing protein n=1 Tax=Thalassotalea sediminis TaxID=1759089 RepID=UPI0025733711|nr:PDZ domain-containing protein [Thalassotalea sediminis]